MKGSVKKIILDKGFGFIQGEDGNEYFFHRSGFNGYFDELARDYHGNIPINVEFDALNPPKGPRAENIFRME
jgi:cold shock protein